MISFSSMMKMNLWSPSANQMVRPMTLTTTMKAPPSLWQLGVTTNTIHLKLRTDNYASETTWQVINEDGDVMAEGGPIMVQNNQVVFDNDIALPASGCYDYHIR